MNKKVIELDRGKSDFENTLIMMEQMLGLDGERRAARSILQESGEEKGTLIRSLSDYARKRYIDMEGG